MQPTTSLKAHWMHFSLLAIFLAGCSSPTPVVTTQPAVSTETPSPTPLPPTATATPLPPSPTSSPTATFTASPTVTQTSVPPSLVVDQNVTCLNGPGEIYGVRAYLSANTTPRLYGSTAERDWFAVQAPDIQADCWVSTNFVTLQGEVNLLPVLTPPPLPPPPPTATPYQTGLKYFLIAPGAGGPFGCGDGLVYFLAGIKNQGSVEENIIDALNALLKLQVKDVDGYYNALYNARAKAKIVYFNAASGHAEIHLSGTIPKPKDVCESKRIHAQIWETVRQFSRVKSIEIWIGGLLLGDWLAVGDG